MMPDTAGCWPDLGEMDILEMINGDGRAHATYHWDANYPAKNCSQVPQLARAAPLCRWWMCAALALLFTAGWVTLVPQPDGHKMHGSHIKISTWDSQFHECAYERTTPPPLPSAAAAATRMHCTSLTPRIRYALERSTQHVAFVYDGLLVLNVSLAAYPDVKLWEVGGFVRCN
jgi:hypothetical protein